MRSDLQKKLRQAQSPISQAISEQVEKELENSTPLYPYIVPEPSPGRLFHMLLTRQVSDSLHPVPNDPKPILRCSSAKLLVLCFLAVLRDLNRSGMFKWVKLKCQK